jgi:hypothetical protein
MRCSSTSRSFEIHVIASTCQLGIPEQVTRTLVLHAFQNYPVMPFLSTTAAEAAVYDAGLLSTMPSIHF